MGEFADDVAAHIISVWDTDTGNRPKPDLTDNFLDNTWEKINKSYGRLKDVVLVLDDGEETTAFGWSLVRKIYRATIFIYTKSIAGTPTTQKGRLEAMMDQLEHVLDSRNHLIAGYTYHQTTNIRITTDQSDRNKIPKHERAQMTFIAYKKSGGLPT
jgi:hypothetical protein